MIGVEGESMVNIEDILIDLSMLLYVSRRHLSPFSFVHRPEFPAISQSVNLHFLLPLLHR